MANINSISGNFSANRPDPSQMKAKLDSMLKAAGATDAEISSITGPEDVQTLASKYGVNLPQPPQRPEGAQGGIFGGQGGEMPPMNGGAQSGPPQEIVSALKAGGATDEQIAAINGPQAAQALAAQLGVTLPQPPAPPTQGGQMNQLA